jgi:hypothetical protein
MVTRRRFLQAAGSGLLLPPFVEARTLYRGPESNPEDSESIFRTHERLAAARDTLNALRPRLDLVFLVGDYFHDYPSTDLDFYFTTTLDRRRCRRFLPDGRHLLYTTGPIGAVAGSTPFSLYVQEVGSADRVKLRDVGASNVVYASGHLLYIQDNTLLAQPFDPVPAK